MLKALDVYLWGTRIGTAYSREGHPIVQFEYSDEIRDLGVEVSPLTMPLGAERYEFPDLPTRSFKGLPGLLSDSLPDKFGNKVIAAWLRERGRNSDDLNALERLACTGKRGMGALEYVPSLLDAEDSADSVDVAELAMLANDVLKDRTSARAELKPGMSHYAPILRVGSSAGGARAKALIGWNEKTGEVRSGQVKLPADFGYWLIKFDGLDGNGDKEGDDKWGYGRVEFAYSQMAKAAGIKMTDCRLWNRRHFMTKRFDRLENGGKLHMLTLGGLAHMDFNNPLLYSYEEAFDIVRTLVNDASANEQMFRRMVFNVLAWNCDDHVKNIAYLMDRNGRWTLAPAYDECYAYNPAGAWTGAHQMSVNGKRRDIAVDDLIAVAPQANMRERKARQVIDQVRAAVADWSRFAAEAEVKDEFVDKIGRVLAA